MGRAGRQLAEVLPPGPLAAAAGQLLAAAASPLAAALLTMRDIGVDDCRELGDILAPIVEEGPYAAAGQPLPPPPVAGGKGKKAAPAPADEGGPLRGALVAAAKNRAVGYQRLAALLAMLDAKLADIVARWERRELQAAGLSRREVEGMVCALFEDTAYRSQCLARIVAAAGAGGAQGQ